MKESLPLPLSADQPVLAAGPTEYLKELRDLLGHRLLLVPGCAIVTVDRGRILLHRRADSGEWDVIGGFMELGETFEDTARREVREELGLEIDWLGLIGVYGGTDFTCPYPNGDLTQMAGALFVARVRGDVALDHQRCWRFGTSRWTSHPTVCGEPLGCCWTDTESRSKTQLGVATLSPGRKTGEMHEALH
jgi:8-oxo-dGTP pyrophosphatase MutT (NUDIX family)